MISLWLNLVIQLNLRENLAHLYTTILYGLLSHGGLNTVSQGFQVQNQN